MTDHTKNGIFIPETTPDLFAPFPLRDLTLPNRVVMAPLTRSRAGEVPREMNAAYYAQRATAGLIIDETTNISQQGKGYAFTRGIYTDTQVAGWRLVTEAVHAKGSKILCKLWHVGCLSHPSLQENGALPVAPSAVRPKGQAFAETGIQAHVTPRALDLSAIPGLIDQYRHATAATSKTVFA